MKNFYHLRGLVPQVVALLALTLISVPVLGDVPSADVQAAFRAMQAAAPQKIVSKTVTVPGIPVYYYIRDSRVNVTLALDEVFVKETGAPKSSKAIVEADAAKLKLSNASAESAGGDGNEYFLRVANAQDAVGLSANAASLKSLGATRQRDVKAVLYINNDGGRSSIEKQVVTNQFAVKVTGNQSIDALAAKYNATVVEKFPVSPNTYILQANGAGLLAAIETANAIYESELNIEFCEPLIARQQAKKLTPNDTLFAQQWHLKNTAQTSGGVAGNDVNITGAWDSFTGTGINIAVTDDGVQTSHPDLSANCRTDIDRDVFSGDDDPSPVIANGDEHGNSVAGVAAARGNNSLGVTGAAYTASIVGVRLTAGATTDTQEATAMGWQVSPGTAANRVSINTNSWGPSDNGANLTTFGSLTKAAFENAVANGRGGKGTIFTWAAGNGRCVLDEMGYDGYASSRFVIGVGATGANGTFSYYSEPGASMLVNTPSNYGTCGSGPTAGITTTDLVGTNGYNTAVTGSGGDYTNNTGAIGFGGTSSATPLAAGCIALILQANPNLGWRDVRSILIDTATKNDPTNSGWLANGSGRLFNHAYGYGRINASAAVAAAPGWVNFPAEATPITGVHVVNVAIPDNNTTGITDTINIAGPSNFVIEYVEVTLNATHTYRGDLGIILQAPGGMKSTLASKRNDSGDDYSAWLFTSVAHWGENPNGAWKLNIADLAASDLGTFSNWGIKFYGHLTAAPGPPKTDIQATTTDLSGWELGGSGYLATLPQPAGGSAYIGYPTGSNPGNFNGFSTVPVRDFPTNIVDSDPFNTNPGANRITAAGTTSLTMNANSAAIGYLRFGRTLTTNISANSLLRFRVRLESADNSAASKDNFNIGMGSLKTGVTNTLIIANTCRAFSAFYDASGPESKFYNPPAAPGADFDSYLIAEAADNTTGFPVFVDLQPTDSAASATGNDIKVTQWSLSSFNMGNNRANMAGKAVVLNRGNPSIPMPYIVGENLTPEPSATSFTFGTNPTQATAAGQITGVGGTGNSSINAAVTLAGTTGALIYTVTGALVPSGATTYYPDFRQFSFYTAIPWLDIDHPTGGHFRATNGRLYVTDVWASTSTPSSTNLPQLRINTNLGSLDSDVTSHFIQPFGSLNTGAEIQTFARAYSSANLAQVGPAFAGSVPGFVSVEFLQPSLTTMNTNASVIIHRITVTEFSGP